jgi:hypothetical protein
VHKASLAVAVLAVTGLAAPAFAQTPAPTPQRVLITRIEVNSPEGSTDQFQSVFREQVAASLAKCSPGTYPTTLRVAVTKYYRANPSFNDTMSAGSVLQGEVQLVDAADDKVLTTHKVRSSSAGWTNLNYQFATLADVEAQMARDFGAKLCSQVFTAKK